MNPVAASPFQYLSFLLVGIFLGRVSISLPLEYRVSSGSSNDEGCFSIALEYLSNIGSPLSSLLETFIVVMPLVVAVSIAASIFVHSKKSERPRAFCWLLAAVISQGLHYFFKNIYHIFLPNLNQILYFSN